MTILIEIDPPSVLVPVQVTFPNISKENENNKVYLSRVSFKEINALNSLEYVTDFLSQVCNYCNKAIKNEVRNDYRTIMLCGHHYHTECICNCSTDHISIVRCINCFEKMDKIKDIVKCTYSIYDENSDNIVNNRSNHYPLLYKRKFYDFLQLEQ
jgi:hypothetical protein